MCIRDSLTGAYRFMGLITALWNAGRVQGIREERARRKRKAQTDVYKRQSPKRSATSAHVRQRTKRRRKIRYRRAS